MMKTRQAGQTKNRVIAYILAIAAVLGLFLTVTPPPVAVAAGTDTLASGDTGYYFLIGRDNFDRGLDTGLLETEIEIPIDLQPFFGGETSITYNELYKLIGSPEQDMYHLGQANCPYFSGLTSQEWAALTYWLNNSIAAPRDIDGDGYADLDGIVSGTTSDGIIALSEQGYLHSNKYFRAMAYNVVHIGTNPVEPYSTAGTYARTAGYDKDPTSGDPIEDKLLDYHLTEDNKVTIPARFNKERDDILITARTQMPIGWSTGEPGASLPGTPPPELYPDITLSVTDEDGVDVEKKSVNADFYMNANIALKVSDYSSLYNGYSTVIGNWNGSTLAIFPLFTNVPGGANTDLSTSDAVDAFQGIRNWLSGTLINFSSYSGVGAQLKLRGFYREEIDEAPTTDETVWQATDAEREENAVETVTITSSILNGYTNPSNQLATGNEAVMYIEVTRPWIESGDNFDTDYLPGVSDFDTLLGMDSITIHDNGVYPEADSSGDVDYVGTANAEDRTVVILRTMNVSTWVEVDRYNLGNQTEVDDLDAELLSIFTAASGVPVDVQLIYLYAAADADNSIIGELPKDILADTGAYATPLLRTITLTETIWDITYHANTPSGATAGTVPSPILGIVHGSSQQLSPATSVPTKSGGTYAFKGWSETPNPALNAAIDFAGDATIASVERDYDLYAVWTWKSDGSGGGGGGGGGTTPSPSPEPAEIIHTQYIFGYPDETVRPQGNLTRAEAATVFYRLLGDVSKVVPAENYSDVDADDWFYEAVATVTVLGLANGYPDGTFKPNATITRAELSRLLKTFADYTKMEQKEIDSAVKLTDIDGHWAYDYVVHGAKVGWIVGYPDGTFKPDAAITRAEFVALVNRLLNRDPKRESKHLPGVVYWSDNANRDAWYYLDIQEASKTHVAIFD